MRTCDKAHRFCAFQKQINIDIQKKIVGFSYATQCFVQLIFSLTRLKRNLYTYAKSNLMLLIKELCISLGVIAHKKFLIVNNSVKDSDV